MKYIIMLIMLSGICLAQDSTYYVTYNRAELDSINMRINRGLDGTIRNYEASQYFSVQFDSVSQRYWAEIPVNDARQPQRFLTEMEKVSLVDKKYMIKQRLISE